MSVTRRDLLAVAGVGVLAGCTGEQARTTDSNENRQSDTDHDQRGYGLAYGQTYGR